jgi:hypothetical protein
MNVHDALWQLGLLPGQSGVSFQISTDSWFAVAAIVILWAYIMLAPGRATAES